jgi:hypothetical protein
LISLHNYFIMHGIKYFFLNKNNQTIQGGQKNFQGGKLPKNTIFQNPGGHVPPWITLDPPLLVTAGSLLEDIVDLS